MTHSHNRPTTIASTFYHASALENHDSIRNNGLQTSQRGTNQFGLDSGVNYVNIYGNAHTALLFQKLKTIHLTPDFKHAASYAAMIAQEHKTTAVIYQVTLPNSFIMKKDSEDSNSVCATQDIPAKHLSIRGVVK
jgi:hypothetical protein